MRLWKSDDGISQIFFKKEKKYCLKDSQMTYYVDSLGRNVENHTSTHIYKMHLLQSPLRWVFESILSQTCNNWYLWPHLGSRNKLQALTNLHFIKMMWWTFLAYMSRCCGTMSWLIWIHISVLLSETAKLKKLSPGFMLTWTSNNFYVSMKHTFSIPGQAMKQN